MEALKATYGDTSSDSDRSPPSASSSNPNQWSAPLPPPPLSLLNPPNSIGNFFPYSLYKFPLARTLSHLFTHGNICYRCLNPSIVWSVDCEGTFDYFPSGQASRVRSFPHVDGNYALHVYIPVVIPPGPKKELCQFLKKVASLVPGLHAVDVDVPLYNLLKDDDKLEQVALGRDFHISMGRTVPIRVHQIDSVVAMLRQKLQFQRRYWIDFTKWEVFVNDEHTRSFLSVEVKHGGLAEITKQIQAVNDVYRLHNLPEFYEDPRPHISIAWASGDTYDMLKSVVEELSRYLDVGESSNKCVFAFKFRGIECKIGKKKYKICKLQEE